MTWVSFFVDQTTSTWYKCVFVQRRSWRDGIDYGYIGVVCSRYVSMRVELLRRVVLLFANAFSGASSSIFGEEVTHMEQSIGRSRVAKPYTQTQLCIYVCALLCKG